MSLVTNVDFHFQPVRLSSLVLHDVDVTGFQMSPINETFYLIEPTDLVPRYSQLL